jgi:hypothetical protein
MTTTPDHHPMITISDRLMMSDRCTDRNASKRRSTQVTPLQHGQSAAEPSRGLEIKAVI